MKTRSVGRRLLSKFLVPVTKNYLQQPRKAKLFGMHLDIPSGVFHPTLFFSTKSMCRFLSKLELTGVKLMEVGCGSGAVSIYAQKKGAQVYCCDINPLAITTTLLNAKNNSVHLSAVESDLFESVEKKSFDIILNNPPFYPGEPSGIEDYAWYAGKELEYFDRFFKQCVSRLGDKGCIYMVLSSDCDIDYIKKTAQKYFFTSKMMATYRHLLEKSHILCFSMEDNL